MSAADLEAQAKPNVFDAITQLPQLQGSTGDGYNTGSTTTGLIGLSRSIYVACRRCVPWSCWTASA